MSNVIDISREKESGEISQFTVLQNGQPNLKKGTAENILLYDPANELPFEDGLYEFLSGEQALILSAEDPEIIVAPTENEYCYILRARGNTVETTPKQAEDILRGIKEATIDEDFEQIISVYDTIMAEQVRRHVINTLDQTFSEPDRIEETPSGWLIDDFFLVDWTASMYTKNDDPDENDVKRSGSSVVETDRSYEFVQLHLSRDINPIEVSIGGEAFRLTEREMLFLAKVKWLLGRRDYHPDMPFWKYVDKRTAVDWQTGEPTSDDEDDEDEPDLDKFSL